MNKTVIVPMQYTKNQEDIVKTLEYIKTNNITPVHIIKEDIPQIKDNEGICFYRVQRAKSIVLLVHVYYECLIDETEDNRRYAGLLPNEAADVVAFMFGLGANGFKYTADVFNIIGYDKFKSVKESDLSIGNTYTLVKLGCEFEVLKTVLFEDGSAYTRSMGIFEKFKNADKQVKIEKNMDKESEVEEGQIKIVYHIYPNLENFEQNDKNN